MALVHAGSMIPQQSNLSGQREPPPHFFCQWKSWLDPTQHLLALQDPPLSRLSPSMLGNQWNYLQIGHSLLETLWVFAQEALFVQELGISPVGGWLEKPIVQHVLEAFVEGAENLLLCHPDGCIGVETKAFLKTGQGVET